MSPTGEYLQVTGSEITLHGEPVLLKGAGLGGWMNMENFITGYPGHEYQMRAAMKEVLGEEKYEYFFDRFLHYFFDEDDARFFASLKLNCIRLPVNYRHFEDDMNPGVFKPQGLKHLDRVIDLCAKYGIYTVIDLHALPGGQNFDWHSDSGSHQADFWVHKDFQDRVVRLWEWLAEHYKSNTWVAGFNPLNEPTDSEHTRLLSYYVRLEAAIRAIDPHHILFLDGNTFGADMSRFAADKRHPLPNTVYACHDYSRYGFPNPPEPWTGTKAQVEYQEKTFARKVEYMKEIGGPIWNGEWGPVYQQASDGIPEWEKINEQRYQVLECQLGIYAKNRTSWSIWLYKDIGFQGMVYVPEDSKYRTVLKEWLEKKKSLAIDAWGVDDTPTRAVFEPLYKWVEEAAPHIFDRYPSVWGARGAKRWISRMVREMLVSEELCYEYASYFKDMGKEELDEMAKSFAFKNCQQRSRLNELLTADTKHA